jgi:hypothetical protein
MGEEFKEIDGYYKLIRRIINIYIILHYSRGYAIKSQNSYITLLI